MPKNGNNFKDGNDSLRKNISRKVQHSSLFVDTIDEGNEVTQSHKWDISNLEACFTRSAKQNQSERRVLGLIVNQGLHAENVGPSHSAARRQFRRKKVLEFGIFEHRARFLNTPGVRNRSFNRIGRCLLIERSPQRQGFGALKSSTFWCHADYVNQSALRHRDRTQSNRKLGRGIVSLNEELFRRESEISSVGNDAPPKAENSPIFAILT